MLAWTGPQWTGPLVVAYSGPSPPKFTPKIVSFPPTLRWAKSCDSYRSYHRDSKHWRSLVVILVGRFARIDSRFACSRFEKKTFFANRPSNGIDARTGRESREFQCESEREDAIRANLAKCFKNRYVFLRIDSRESVKRWCANRLPTKVVMSPSKTQNLVILDPAFIVLRFESSDYWEEPSMDQCQCWGKLLKNFQDHWSSAVIKSYVLDLSVNYKKYSSMTYSLQKN